MRWASFILIILGLNVSAQDRTNIYDTIDFQTADTMVVIGKIDIIGNKVTRDKIILREIEFHTGDTISQNQLEKLIVNSKQNLINRSLFNFVTFTKKPYQEVYDIEVAVTERWYIWPIPIINTAGRNLNAWWEERDFGRLNYGIDLRVENFRGRMERLNIIVQGGFDQRVEARWTIPYLTKKQFLGIGINGGFQWNREVIYETVDNKPQFYTASSGYAQELAFGAFDVTLRPKFNFLHTITLGYDHYKFQDSLIELSPEFAGDETLVDFFKIGYLYKHDFRDYKPYPLKGYYFDVGATKYGIGVTADNVDFWSFSFAVDHYINIYKRWFFAYNFSGWFSNKDKLPYFLTPGFGYMGMEIRGYELYIINGQNLGLFKSNFKFEIIPKTVKRIKAIKTEKFGKIFYALYANLFFDAGYASDKQYDEFNSLSNQLLWGTGLGIDFITYYDLVFRFEYTINKQGDHGFFINLVAPI